MNLTRLKINWPKAILIQATLIRIAFLAALPAAPAALAENIPVHSLKAAAQYPHEPGHFTQGLFFHQGRLYESTGLYGHSALYIKDPLNGRTLQEWRLQRRYFGEGAAIAWGRIYMLTWRAGRGFILEPDTLTLLEQFTYPGEGWGLAFDGQRLIRSDGSPFLFFHGPGGELKGRLLVTASGKPVYNLNELEWLPKEKLILANIWLTDRVAAIDPGSGKVVFWLDLAGLNPFAPGRAPEGATANGLALAPEGDFLWLTGKLWPVIYKVVWPPDGPAASGE